MNRECIYCGEEWHEEDDDYDNIFVCPFCGYVNGMEEENEYT